MHVKRIGYGNSTLRSVGDKRTSPSFIAFVNEEWLRKNHGSGGIVLK